MSSSTVSSLVVSNASPGPVTETLWEVQQHVSPKQEPELPLALHSKPKPS